MLWSQWGRCNIARCFLLELLKIPITFPIYGVLLKPLERWSAAEGVFCLFPVLHFCVPVWVIHSHCLQLVPFANIHEEKVMPRDPCHFLMRCLWCTVAGRKEWADFFFSLNRWVSLLPQPKWRSAVNQGFFSAVKDLRNKGARNRLL